MLINRFEYYVHDNYIFKDQKTYSGLFCYVFNAVK